MTFYLTIVIVILLAAFRSDVRSTEYIKNDDFLWHFTTLFWLFYIMVCITTALNQEVNRKYRTKGEIHLQCI